MILFQTFVYKNWEDERDSSNRVAYVDHPPTNKRDFILNPHNISDLKAHDLGSTFHYSDVFADRREKWSRIICDKTVAEIEAIMDTVPYTNAITLPIYINNNPDNLTVDTTIQWSLIAYVDRYNPDPTHKCWVVYAKGAFKRVEVLCNLAMEDVLDLVRSGTTTTTFSTDPDLFEA